MSAPVLRRAGSVLEKAETPRGAGHLEDEEALAMTTSSAWQTMNR